jgi:hypothetical protein
MIDLTRALARFRAFPNDIRIALEGNKRRTGFCSVPGSRRARKSLLSACSAGDFPLEASQFSKSLIRTLCSTSGSLTAIVIVES